MTLHSSFSRVAPSAPPVYLWNIRHHYVQLTGPTSRPAHKQRTVTLALATLPPDIRQAFQPVDSSEHAASPVHTIGHRSFQITRTQPYAGLVISLTRQYNAHRTMARYLRWLEEGIDALPEAFVLYDANDRLLIANSQYSELYPTIRDILRPGITFHEIARTAVQRNQFRYPETPEDCLTQHIDFHARGVGYFEQRLQDGRWVVKLVCKVTRIKAASSGFLFHLKRSPHRPLIITIIK